MTDKRDNEVTRLTIILLRALPNWDRETLSRHSGIYPSQLSGYESGKVVPRPRNFGRLAAAVRVRPHLLAQMKAFLAELVTAWESDSNSSPSSSLSGETSPWGADIVGQEAVRARAELALLLRGSGDRGNV